MPRHVTPRHVNPLSEDRTALAPYNFVPLPSAVFTVADGVQVVDTTAQPWHAQDRYLPGTHSGWIDLSLTTKTLLFIRGAALHPGETADSRDRPESFTVPDPDHPGARLPAIPGSSLRGAVRTLVEILSFAKIVNVSEQKPFFRTVGKDRLGHAYRARMVRNNVKPSGGFLRRDGERWWIEPAEVLRVPHAVLVAARIGFRAGDKPNYHPSEANRELQYRECWVRRDEREWQCRDVALREPPGAADWLRGRLVLTGSAPKKKAEFVFLAKASADRVLIPVNTWRRFLDDDQITNWQEKSFPQDWPAKDARSTAGHPLPGEPVFYLCDDRKIEPDNPVGLVFFGRAQMFRLPYDRCPADLVPQELSGAPLDLAEALFGYVRRKAGDEDVALGGRVRFDDAVAVRGGPEWYERRLVPRILASPKPTAFSQYLTQDGREPSERLTTYLDGDRTVIRGHKLYWHRWDDAQGLEAVEQPDTNGAVPPGDTQSTAIEPVKSGVTFAGRIRFDNLADIELGALLEALQLPGGCAHKIGMAKPLGLGSLRIEVERVTFVDRQARYAGWGHDGRRQDEASAQRCRAAFAAAIREHAQRSHEPLLPGTPGLRGVARLDALYRLLDWDHKPAPSETRYMQIEGGDARRFGSPNEFKNRAVLPTPHAVAGVAEPAWHEDPPVAAPPEVPPRAPSRAPARHAPAHAPMTAPPPRRPRAAVRVGETVECEVLSEKTRKGGLRFRVLADGKSGVLHPQSPSPGELAPGEKLRLTVQATGTEYMLRWAGQATASDGDSSS